MKQINITRDVSGVHFETVSIDVTENVFFTNLDPQAAHWPVIYLCANQLGPAPSPNSSECVVPGVASPPSTVTYGCRFHEGEKGIINVFAKLAADITTLAPATVNKQIKEQSVVTGGQSPYTISSQLFQITNSSGQVIKSGSGSIGPGLQLNPKTDNTGITVSGTPTQVGTYQFTFTVDDGMGRNLQQIQYTMKVT